MSQVIVVGTDGSATAREATRRAAQLAGVVGATLVVVRAYHEHEAHSPMAAYDPTQGEAGSEGLPADVAHPVGTRAAVLAALEAEIIDLADLGVGEIAIVAHEGDPATALLEVAEEEGANLIVVGNKGMTGARRFLLGSVPDKITHHARCDVLVVRTS